MVSYNSNFKVHFIFQLCLTFLSNPKPNYAFSGDRISLEELYTELLNQSPDLFQHHIGLMFTVSSYGDKLYNLTKYASPECDLIAAASLHMMVCEEVYTT